MNKKKSTPPSGKTLVDMAATNLFRLRAEAVQLLDLRGISDIADWFLVATCTSEAQMQAILDSLRVELKAAKVPVLGVEYRAGVRWAVLDAGELMVHLFEENARQEYSLERLWRDGKLENLNPADFGQENATAGKDTHEFL